MEMKKKGLNKIKQRDKKRNPYGMRVDDSARRLADIRKRRIERDYGVTVTSFFPVKKKRPILKKKVQWLTPLEKVAKLNSRKPIIKKVVVKAKSKPLWTPQDRKVRQVTYPIPQAVAVPAPVVVETLTKTAKVIEKATAPVKTDPLKEMVKAGKITQKDLEAYNRST
jgi:hypothetical protein